MVTTLPARGIQNENDPVFGSVQSGLETAHDDAATALLARLGNVDRPETVIAVLNEVLAGRSVLMCGAAAKVAAGPGT